MKKYLPSPELTPLEVSIDTPEYQAVICSIQGWRMTLEDRFLGQANINGDMSILAIFDGHSGPEVAEYLSKNFVKELLSNKEFEKTNYELALKQTFMELDRKLFEDPVERKKLFVNGFSPGSTAMVALISPHSVILANAGDSQAFFYMKSNEVFCLNMIHTVKNHEERDRVSHGGAFVIDGRVNASLKQTRAFGDFEFKNKINLPPEEQPVIALPEVKTFDVGEDVLYFGMGCNGFWEGNKELERFQRVRISEHKGQALVDIVKNVVVGAVASDTDSDLGCDNITGAIVKFSRTEKK